jgi:archaemetzincin
MSDPAIYLLPLGSVPEEILTQVRTAMGHAFGLPIRQLPPRALPLSGYDPHRNQYFSTELLKKMLKQVPADTLKILGITAVDLFIPIMKYIFGEAQVSGKGAIISIFRLRPELYGLDPDRAVFGERIAKEAVHELGHTFGLTHCRDPLCVMNSSCLIGETDCKGTDLCPTCRELYHWSQR